ncbi:MAG TPA: cysteine--tRNA ligase, partial [Chloroflexota bacterium]|nr:cysteine--tRNA ligase [Chloroflexota bacterium]
MRIYDTLSAQKQEFVPEHDPVRMYVCGLTPKNEPHIGHAKLFVAADLIRRYLEYRGYTLRYIQNVTDVDDKIIKRAAEEGITPRAVADKYSASYFASVEALNCRPAHQYPTVTGSMSSIIAMIEGLIEKGYAYVVAGDVYYHVERFAGYGQLSKRNTIVDNVAGMGLQARGKQAVPAAADPDAGDTGGSEEGERLKEDPRDFALWKAAKPGEPQWESPWGPGRPGWHIECSAMSRQELGDRIDLHGGGQDLIFPHHENEIAQSEAFTGKVPFVKYWWHLGSLNVVTRGDDGEEKVEKMSHSLGNFITIKSILARYEPSVVRLFLLSQHYRTPVTYTEDSLAVIEVGWDRLKTAARNLKLLLNWAPMRDVPDNEPIELEMRKETRKLLNQVEQSLERFHTGMDDDFNTAQAIAALYDLAAQINSYKDFLRDPALVNPTVKGALIAARQAFDRIMGVLGLVAPPEGPEVESPAFVDQVERLIARRRELRAARDYAGADAIRDEIKELGVIVEDHSQGTIWRREAR